MIVEKLKTGEVYTLKLITGEEVITRLNSDSDPLYYNIYKPLVLSVTAQGVSMTPFLFTAEIEGNVNIPKACVIALAPTERSTAGQYIKGTSGILSPGEKATTRII
jgi:hypothetical protein